MRGIAIGRGRWQALAVILMAVLPWIAVPDGAWAQTVTIAAGPQAAAGVKTMALTVTHKRPSRVVDGFVVDPSGLLAMRAAMIEATITAHLRDADLARTRLLYHAGRNVSASSLEQAQAAAAMAAARLAAVRGRAVARYGAQLAAMIAAPTGAVARIAAGKAALVAVAAGDNPPRRATAGRNGALRYLGAMARLPTGSSIAGAYYEAPRLPVGMALAVRLAQGAARPGFIVPASAVIYQSWRVAVFLETSPNQFTLFGLQSGVARGIGRGYFVPTGALPNHPVIAVAGAGLLLSLASNHDTKAPDDD